MRQIWKNNFLSFDWLWFVYVSCGIVMIPISSIRAQINGILLGKLCCVRWFLEGKLALVASLLNAETIPGDEIVLCIWDDNVPSLLCQPLQFYHVSVQLHHSNNSLEKFYYFNFGMAFYVSSQIVKHSCIAFDITKINNNLNKILCTLFRYRNISSWKQCRRMNGIFEITTHILCIVLMSIGSSNAVMQHQSMIFSMRNFMWRTKNSCVKSVLSVKMLQFQLTTAECFSKSHLNIVPWNWVHSLSNSNQNSSKCRSLVPHLLDGEVDWQSSNRWVFEFSIWNLFTAWKIQ